MRRMRIITLISLTIGLAINLSGMGTWAAFTSSTSNAGNSFTSGTVVLTDDDSNGAMFTLTNMKPTDPAVAKCIAVTYTGNLAANVVLFRNSIVGNLAQYLNLVVTRGTGSTFAAAPSCTGFTTSEPDYIGAGAGVIYNGALDLYPLEAGTPIQDPPGTAEVWTTSESHVYKFEVSLASSVDGAQGQTASSVDFVWKATNNP